VKILIANDTANEQARMLARQVASDLTSLGFSTAEGNGERAAGCCEIRLVDDLGVKRNGDVTLKGSETLLERVLRELPLDFPSLPLLTEGDSKEVRLWTDNTVVIRFKPTVYSYTANRYGEVAGTDELRAKFTAAVFRRLANHVFGEFAPANAFLAAIESKHGLLIVQKRVRDCNLETRIKRYHIGSPVHRYKYTEAYPSVADGAPISRWTRFDSPVVCFDWRHPLRTPTGERLADEPLSDDYAALWMRDVPHAKEMARVTFIWLENLFLDAGLRLIDMCMFIDREGRTIYGEISPDCMRVRLDLGDPHKAEAADKDLWRTGRAPHELRQRYEQLYRRLFSQRETLMGV
jgi:phosphoribosylaminoimidazole-succinocarboxamide synthase